MNTITQLSENRTLQRIISISCFILATIMLLLIVSQIYYFVAQNNPPANNVGPQNNTGIAQITPPPKDDFFRGMPKESPIMFFIYIFGLIISFHSGIIIHNNLNAKEKKEIKTKIINDILLPEELVVVKLLEENNNQLTQKELVTKSNLNKLKISRVVKRLESLKIVEKYPHGMTNKIKLKLDNSEKK
jgi:predicted transcriptional regulator